MRRLEFTEPNFICDVEDSQGKLYEDLLFRFDTQKELEDYLTEKTFTLVKVSPYDFQKWKTKAKDAKILADEAKNKKDFEYKSAVWGELKQYLFFISKGKCGYCEQKVTGVYAGDVEHYRPKKKVLGDPAHPGYYWLAYDEQNYVPVCSKCNGARAKANHFPLDPTSKRAIAPGDDLTQEKPLLINPLGNDDPTIHFVFTGPEGGKDFGKFTGLTEAGKKSCEVYHLNRPELIEDRRYAYQQMNRHKLLLEAAWKDVAQDLLTEYKMGNVEFTLVMKGFLLSWIQEIDKKEEQVGAARIKAYQEQIEQEKLRQQELKKFIDNDLLMLLAGR